MVVSGLLAGRFFEMPEKSFSQEKEKRKKIKEQRRRSFWGFEFIIVKLTFL
jgi:hypothetical protein